MLPIELNQGDCVELINEDDLYQIIGIDEHHQKCWVREWPISSNGSPVFEIPIKQISSHNTIHKEIAL